MGISKMISKWDDGAKLLLMTLLWSNPTWGFDIDSLYCIKWQYYIFEFLKCESTFPWITPFTSHPNRYWKNKRKFISLWQVSQKLEWPLILINYETDLLWKIGDRFRIMKVTSIDDSGITTVWVKNFSENWEERTKWSEMNLEQISKWFKGINSASLNQ